MGRLHIDCVLGTTVFGWACTSALEPAANIVLQLARQATAAEVRTFPRIDVSEALGVSHELPLGFSLCLPVSLWDESGNLIPGDIEILAAGQHTRIEVPCSMSEVLQALEQQQHHAEWIPVVQQMMRQLGQDSPPSRLGSHVLASCQRLAQRIGWSEWPSAPGGACQGYLEDNSGLVWRGWGLGSSESAESFRLYANGHLVPAQVIRTDRADVAATMKAARRQLGFELELPSCIWQHAQPDAPIRLELWVGTLNLCPQGVEWTVEHLRQTLIRLHEISHAKPEVQMQRAALAEHQYGILVGLEHWLAVHEQVDLPHLAREWLLAQAHRFGLVDRLPAQSRPSDLSPVRGPQHDLATIELWDLLRRFNEMVEDDGHNALDVLSQMCARERADEAQCRLVCALIPYFCGLGRYDDLRPWLPGRHLKALASDHTAWGLSLLLPELVWTERYGLARRVMLRLASSPRGWLNTECVACAVHRSLEHWPRSGTDQSHAVGWVRAVLTLLEVQASDYWGRSHDLHLTQAAVDLMVYTKCLPGDLARTVLSCVLRLQAFHPGFWSALKQQWPADAEWPSELQWAYSRFVDFESAVWAGDFSANRWMQALGSSATQECFDAALALRDLALHAVAVTPADHGEGLLLLPLPNLLSPLGPREMLRLAAHPQARPAWLTRPSALAQVIQGETSPSAAALRTCRAHVMRALWNSKPIDSAEVAVDLTVLSSIDHSGVGVVLSSLVLMMAPSPGGESTAERSLADLSVRWTQVFHDTANHAVPPAALLHVTALLVRWQASQPGSRQLQRLTAECKRLMHARYGIDLSSLLAPPPPPRGALTAPDALRTTLVAIYSCRKNLASRVEQIKASWGKRLEARGIPWLVVVGDGDGQLDRHLLQLAVPDDYESLPLKTLALIRWVHDHTDFTHLLKIDDDCHLAVDQFFDQSPHLAHHYLGRKLARSIGGTDRVWHQSKSSSPLARQAIDKSPEPSAYADGGSGYCLSRFAMSSLLNSLLDTAGARLTRSAYMEDKLVGDLLSLKGIAVCEDGYETLVRRRIGVDPLCVNAYRNTFYPSLASPTMVTHLDDATALDSVDSQAALSMLRPAKIWPSYEAPKLVEQGSNQLELLSPLPAIEALQAATVIVVAVLRNERLLLPHFLAHYRKLGAPHFIFVDNLSDDGSRDYLVSQPDVVLYSADTEYRQSHYGVAWQQAVLSAHALGKWVVLADIDEFLVFDACEDRSLAQWTAELDQERVNAVSTLMVDMYPKGSLSEADFQQQAPFECAPYFDRSPLIAWKLGSGCFSNSRTWLSGLRHRLIEDSAPNFYTSQKIAVLKYQPWIRLSEGLHYASNVRLSQQTAYFAHFKYHAGFEMKVRTEVARKQHFNDAEEYQRYTAIIAEGSQTLWTPESLKFTHSSDYRRATALEDRRHQGANIH
ncbi:MAG: hypothetical protein C4K60_12635 [Ideonella sp. MAG2]|nr:MAG: hypothetical protein C4K60_12635 [Ideonella sp. MAG2]